MDGVGLGLSICQWIAQAHGGEISATSRPDHTVLTLRLPLHVAQPGTPERKSGDETAGTPIHLVG